MPIIRDIILSPFLNKGFISEYFKWSGNIPDDDLLRCGLDEN